MTMPDTNRRVAEACGYEILDVTESGVVHARDGRFYFSFDPVGDPTWAVEAAEKFGLFMHHRDCHLTGLLLPGGKVGWAVWEGGEMIGSGTFTEAICQAILALADKGPEALRKDHNE